MSFSYPDNSFQLREEAAGFDLCLEHMLEVQKNSDERLRPERPAASEGFCSFLHPLTHSHGHCVTSKADSFKERNPILCHY